MKHLRRSLAVKLFVSFLLVVLAGMGVLVLVSQLTISTAFNRHLGQMAQTVGAEIADGTQPEAGRGQGMGGPRRGQGLIAEFYQSFQQSFWEALALAGGVALVAALLVSLWLSQRIVRPLRAAMNASRRIADGHYDERVDVLGEDELGQLAHSFNQMAEALEQVETMRQRLIGDVSHELRTPLTAIQGSMEGLIDGVLPATPETFEQIHQEAGRLNRLVNDLQELSRVEAGSFQLDLRPLSLADLAKTIVIRLTRQFEAKGVQLDVSVPSELPNVRADEDRITQVLINLVGNALQYTSQGGTVSLSAERQGNEMVVEVRDTGMGIPAEHLPHIFDRFYRADKSRSRQQGGGSGIGLTIARHLVEAHGGRIWVESEGEGQGSCFMFILPIVQNE
jgi:signal transduction histidine kinase